MTSPGSGGLRVLRGAVLSGVAALIAVVGHLAGGGHLPSLVSLLIAGTVATAVCTASLGRQRSTATVLALLAIAQLGYHSIFTLLGSPASGSLTSGTPASAHDHTIAVQAFQVEPHVGGWTLTMLVAHLMATVVSGVAVHAADRALWAVVGWAGFLALLISRVLASAPTTGPRIARGRPVPAPRTRQDRGPAGLRGPPAAIAA